jgi:hypothetical protein
MPAFIWQRSSFRGTCVLMDVGFPDHGLVGGLRSLGSDVLCPTDDSYLLQRGNVQAAVRGLIVSVADTDRGARALPAVLSRGRSMTVRTTLHCVGISWWRSTKRVMGCVV